MKQRSKLILLILPLLLLASVARADLLPPGASEARQRYEKFQDVYDRSDQFCRNKEVGASCTIPGTAFEGGGAGVCSRDLADRATQIDLRCKLSAPARIERRVPDGPFFRGSCTPDEEKAAKNAGLTCKDPEPVADRFCAGRKVGDTCNAEFTVDGKQQSEAGRCGVTTEEYSYYQYGRRTATRRVVLCQPLQAAPAAVFEKAPLVDKFKPW